MIWEDSLYLWFLLLIPLLWGGYWWYKRQQSQRRSAYFDDRLVKQLRKNFWQTGDKVRLISFMIATLFFIVALAGPKIGTEVREVQRKGVNMMVALDLSASMNAEDVRPSRLEKAKFEINRLINRLQGDRIGLLVFTDQAFLQVPFTTDYSALRLFIDIVNSEQMPSGGTNFSAAMETALESFNSLEEQEQGNASDVLLFVGDGENHGGGYDSQLNALVDNGVIIFSVGIGTPNGSPIPVYNENGTLVSYERDSDGSTINTRLESEAMQDIANEGGGEYYEIRSGSDNIEPFFSKLDELERGEFSSQEFADYKNQYQILLVVGLFFLMITLFFPETKPKMLEKKQDN
ncbi:vWA domain-containing protein [Rhodohalobacter sp. 614A]|uniref:vWA domain-containing protein n=1 Tax=Rhodohalobacter sp. 614A TaxID=2908649 RepID=UPI001F346943|nr:VWA domain-containing protein [Rhodohalobacter sp. 614A]